jgi:predicted transcriptional regulator
MPAHDRRPARQRHSEDSVARYLGELQAEVMGIFWTQDSATVRELVGQLKRKPPLAYTTVLTLVTRLWSRGLLAREPEGRGFRYRAAKSREEFLAELSDELIERLFTDFGEIAVARLSQRLDTLPAAQRRRLQRARRKR